MTSETREGPTPAGGVKSVAYYLDNDRNLVDKAKATRIDIVELDERGSVLRTTYLSNGQGG